MALRPMHHGDRPSPAREPAASGRILARPLVAALLMVACAGPGRDAGPIRAADPRPVRNVVVILADDLGWADIGANNPGGFHPTPNLDRLAASGMRFTQAYAAAPVCSPTRYSLMTGRYPTRAAATEYFSGRRVERFAGAECSDRMPRAELTLAEAMRAGGHATFFAGKWHLGPDEQHWPEAQGFDVNRGGWMRGGPYGGDKYFSPYGNPRLEDGPDGEHLPARLAAETAAFIAERSAEQRPFLAYLSFYSVHTPLMAPAERVAFHTGRAAALDPQGRAEPVDADFGAEDQHHASDRPRRVRVRQRHPTYAAMVESMDAAVGRVLDALEQAGVAEDTLVVFFSDNGGLATSEGSPTSNLPLRAGKGWLYEGGIREPLLVRWPGVTVPGSTCDTPVISTDLYPTVLAATGLPPRPAQHRDGVDLSALLAGGELAPRDLFWHYPHYSNQGGFPGGAIRHGDWKLLEDFEDGALRLHHLGDDLGERHDVAADHPALVAELRERLHIWYGEVGAGFLQARPGGPPPWRP